METTRPKDWIFLDTATPYQTPKHTAVRTTVRQSNLRPLAALRKDAYTAVVERLGAVAMGDTSLASETPEPHSAYLKFIANARKGVAITMAVFGAGFVVCVNVVDSGLTWRKDTGIWALGIPVCEIGILVCLVVTLAFIIEHLARPVRPTPFTLRSVLVRSLLILLTVGAICLAMASAYGFWQATGAVVGTFLLLAAVREHGSARATRAFLAAIVVTLTVMGTQTAYQYARWHSDEIVAAGCNLMDQCPKTGYRPHSPHRGTYTSNAQALVGQEIEPSDPRVPDVLRKLGARRIWVDDERVAVYVGLETEFQIYRLPHPDSTLDPVWGFRGKAWPTKITDRLWTNDY
jgi:hypothetical protein